MARIIRSRNTNKPIPIIIGAGLTEQWYFTHLHSLFNLKIKIHPRFFGKENIYSIDKKIQKVLSDGGIAICVFDADVSTWNDVENARLKELRKTYSKNKKVIICDSLPSIEYWFLLHYSNTNRNFGTSKSVIKELKKFLPGYCKRCTYLKEKKWVFEMESQGKMKLACERAQKFGMAGESYSNIWKIIVD